MDRKISGIQRVLGDKPIPFGGKSSVTATNKVRKTLKD